MPSCSSLFLELSKGNGMTEQNISIEKNNRENVSFRSKVASLVSRDGDISRIVNSFSLGEKVFFWFFVVVLIGSVFAMLYSVNQSFLVKTPAHGGHFSEGIIGSPRFINPLLALSDADRDLTALVYSGLLKASPDGGLIPDLAESYSISEDGLVYTFVLKDNIFFHNDTPVTVDDIIFTVFKAQDPTLKSPKRASWDGIVVKKISDTSVQFVLNEPYAPFLENATLGILPSSIWKDADSEQFPFSQFNTEPIGTGPYKVSRIKRSGSGVPEFYELKAYGGYALSKPFIDTMTIKFYSNEDALTKGFREGAIEGMNSISAEVLDKLKDKNIHVEHPPLPRIFAIFFNQNQAPIFSRKEVRRALGVALSKQDIVKDVLGGYGTVIDSPVPPGILPHTNNSTYIDSQTLSQASTTERVGEILESDGFEWDEEESVWKRTTKKENLILQFSLATSNAPELKQAGEMIIKQWKASGISVNLNIFETGDLNQNVIRPRKYDAMFFGEIIGREVDLFAFWHSSQRNDPGLNIALYANIASDKLLEEARTISDKAEREEKYKEFEAEVANDIPAIFIYAPDFIYVVPEQVGGVRIGSITTPSERFLNVHEWFIETDKVWSVFK